MDPALQIRARVKLVVATVLLAGAAVSAWIAVERVAPESVASASTSLTSSRARPAAGTVESVRFSGPGLRAAFLADVVATREGAPLREDELVRDRARILEALVARGHLDAKVGAPTVDWTGDRVAWVDFPVDAGPVYVVRRVEVVGKQVRHHPALAAVPTVTPGAPAIGEHIDASVDLLRDWLRQRRIRGNVTVDVTPEPYGKQLDVTFRID